MEGVPAEHKAILDQYVPKWDAGVSRRVQALQQTYGPIEDLLGNGFTVDELSTAAQLYDQLLNNPETAKEMLGRTFGWDQPQQQPQPAQVQPQQQGYGQLQQPAQVQLPPELTQQMAQMQQFMQQTAQTQQQLMQQQQEAQENAQLDEYLGLLKQEKGDFDQDYVLSLMANGVDGADAVDRFNALVQRNAQPGTPQLPVPPVLSGGSAAPGTKPIAEMNGKERQATVMAMLQAANTQS
jgi:hypothetical protein